MKFLFLLLLVDGSWQDAGTVKAKAVVVKPKPIEPDAPNNGPLKAIPITVEAAFIPGTKPLIYPTPVAPHYPQPWHADSQGLWWVLRPDGGFSSSNTASAVQPFGQPYNMGK